MAAINARIFILKPPATITNGGYHLKAGLASIFVTYSAFMAWD
jgi:hypothetical protein